MNTLIAAHTGEAMAIAHFVQEGYEVFVQFGGHSLFDLVIYKPEEGLKTVEVKATSARKANGAYEVSLRSIRNNSKRWKIGKFSGGIDYLAVFIVPENRVVVLDATGLEGRSTVRVS